MLNKTLLIRVVLVTLALLGTASAASIYPTFAEDGVAVDPSSPYLGASVFANPGSTWLVMSNDNFGGGDNDFNDGAFYLIFGADGIGMAVPAGYMSGDTSQTWKFSSTTFTHSQLGIRYIFGYTQNAEFVVENHVNGQVFVSGAGSRNPDGKVHWWVANASQLVPPGSGGNPTDTNGTPSTPTATPEPGTMGACMVAGVFLWRRFRKR